MKSGQDNLSENKVTIAVIDDEAGVLRALTLMLNAFGFHVFAFSDPVEALKTLPSIEPDWIISDLRMPEVDGFEVLEHRNASCPHIPFILISGHAKEAEIEKAKALGAEAVLQKPFNPAELTEIINSYQLQKAASN